MVVPEQGVGEVLWTPAPERMRESAMYRYIAWLEAERGLRFDDYEALWRWSTTEIEAFWASVWDFLDLRPSTPYTRVLDRRIMPGARWFEGAHLNYAEHAFRYASPDHPAILFRSERHPLTEISWAELERHVASVAAALRELGVEKGDRVVAFLPNIPETVIAFLACASIGAVWSCCSPEFGTNSVIDRFRQIEPKVLIAVDGYQYNGKRISRLAEVDAIRRALPGLQHTVLVSYLEEEPAPAGPGLPPFVPWATLLGRDASLRFEALPFDHPLWILYSSGTTGLPKAIVHGVGGVLVERAKVSVLHHDSRPGDRQFWFTTTGWVMWNGLVGGLLGGCTIVCYDGSPAYPDLNVLWDLAEESRLTMFGTSPTFISNCMKAGLEPGKTHDYSDLRMVGVTGSPLPPEGFDWIYEKVKRDVWLCPLSGGTDVASAWVGGHPLLPVRRGEMQCRMLGAKVEVWDDDGRPVQPGELGELVVTEPVPSMPLFFWNDQGNQRYLASYFEKYPGVWCHGDWIRQTATGGWIIQGRSDSTLNRYGVRMGAGDIYSVVDEMAEIVDSLVVGVELPGGRYYMPLFVVLAPGIELDDALEGRIREVIRSRLSPRHVPDEILALPALPRTLNGKRLEVPVKRILAGIDPRRAVNRDSITHPEAIPFFIELAGRLATTVAAGRS